MPQQRMQQVSKFGLHPEAISKVTWKCYEYVGTGKFLINGQERKKIALVAQKTSPGELFKYFQDLLKQYPTTHSCQAQNRTETLKGGLHVFLNIVNP